MCVAHAAVVCSGMRNVPVPLDFEGTYLRMDTGATAGAFPADWATAPWINPFFGGVDLGNSPLLRPVITGTSQVVNLPLGDYVGSMSYFAGGESGSTTHVGDAVGQFVLGMPGYMGFVFNTAAGAPDQYGWLELEISNTGSGKIIAWAYEDSGGTAIQVGAVPEPTSAGLFGVAFALFGIRCWRRRR
jgi:hypothetical protein